MQFCGGEQIGLEPEGKKFGIALKSLGDVGLSSREGMHLPQRLADLLCQAGINPALQKQGFPDRVVLGCEVLHKKNTAWRVAPQHGWHQLGKRWGNGLVPGVFKGITRQRRLPVCRHLERGQSPLCADASTAEINLPNVGRHAAHQLLDASDVSGLSQPQAGQGCGDQLRVWVCQVENTLRDCAPGSIAAMIRPHDKPSRHP